MLLDAFVIAAFTAAALAFQLGGGGEFIRSEQQPREGHQQSMLYQYIL
jgi:hypothetical protein